MIDLTSELVPRFRNHHLSGLELGETLVHPYYQGGSILNLPSTVSHLLGLQDLGAGPFIPEIMEPLLNSVDGRAHKILMILMDALSLHRFQRWLSDGHASGWSDLTESGLLAPLTSVVPSTTSSALPTIWSGLSPAQHGMVGYELLLKEYGLVANMIRHSPFSIQGGAGTLESAGFKPEKALPGPTLGTHLRSHGIRAHSFQHYSIVHSGLSRVFLNDVEVHSFGEASDMWINVRRLFEDNSDESMFVKIYWGHIDRLSHDYGPDSEYPRAEFAQFSNAFRRLFLDQIDKTVFKNTLLLLTADHGQITTPIDPFYDLKNHPNLLRRLHIFPTGENRVSYLFIRPGQVEAVREYIDRVFKQQFIQLDPGYAVKSGLFGPGEPHPHLKDRIGDVLLISTNNAYLWWGNKENHILGRHGGLSFDEMFVPFFAAQLGRRG